MRIIIHDTYEALSKWTAYSIAAKMRQFKPSADRPFVLGVPAGQSPVGVFQQLISLHQKGEVTFRNVVAFGLNEYVGIPQDSPQSHYSVLWNNFFSQIDIPADNVRLLDGNAPDLARECSEFEEAIRTSGGIHLFLGSIGPDGHIGFNEPGSSLSSRTRIKTITKGARTANARWFGNDVNKVPKTGLTMGVGTIMDSREVVMVISGHSKARGLQKILEGEVNHMWTVSMMQLHRHGMVVCDEDATEELKVGTVRYFRDIERESMELPEL